jgi:hypothetical protein
MRTKLSMPEVYPPASSAVKSELAAVSNFDSLEHRTDAFWSGASAMMLGSRVGDSRAIRARYRGTFSLDHGLRWKDVPFALEHGAVLPKGDDGMIQCG